jgi:hypothetical protein
VHPVARRKQSRPTKPSVPIKASRDSKEKSAAEGRRMISTPNKPRKMAIQVLASTFSRKKIRAPKTTNNGADCKMAVAEDMGVKAMAKT